MATSVNIEPNYKSLYGESNTNIRVTAPDNLPTGYTFEASYTFPDGVEEISFEATVVSKH